MNKPTVDVESVVRQVLADLAVAPSAQPGTGPFFGGKPPIADIPKAEKMDLSPSVARGGELVISARVITIAEVAGRLESVCRLVVTPMAIVTPAVRDELLNRKITLVRGDAQKSSPASAVQVALTASGTDFDPAGLVADLARNGHRVRQATSDCLIAAVDQLATELAGPNMLGVLLTAHVAAGLCLANRLRGVRAVGGADAAAVVGANLLVVDPRAGAFFQLKQTVVEFCRGGVRPCPQVFRARLA